MELDFSGRVALITGAGKGLGRTYARWLAERGCAVVVNNRVHPDTPSSAAQVAGEIIAAGGRAVADEHSIETEAAANAMAQHAVAAFGRLDILVCNAAELKFVQLLDHDIEDLRRMVDINLWGTIYLVRTAWRLMLEQGYGRIILTTSAGGIWGSAGLTGYGATKGAIMALAKCVALEVPEGADIRINAVSPLANTPMSSKTIGGSADQMKPEFVAPVVAWLASEACSANGVTLHVGGGWVKRVRVMESLRAEAADAGSEAWLRTLNETLAETEPAAAGVAARKLREGVD